MQNKYKIGKIKNKEHNIDIFIAFYSERVPKNKPHVWQISFTIFQELLWISVKHLFVIYNETVNAKISTFMPPFVYLQFSHVVYLL